MREERQQARALLERLERMPLVRGDFTIEVVSWDDPDAPAPMLATLTPQEAVLRALPKPSECDLTVMILWSRMGTPLTERKPSGSQYLSGTEWEFEDARRAGKPVLLYRRTTPFPAQSTSDATDQQRRLQLFFEQFVGPGGVLRGGVTGYDTIDEFTSRLQKDVESLLPTLRRRRDPLPADAGWLLRSRQSVQLWHGGRLLLALVLGLLLTAIAGTAVSAFETALQRQDAPVVAYFVRGALIAVAAALPLALLVVAWWWLGRGKSPPAD